MKQKYYSLPLNAENLMTKKGQKTCSLKESIAHHIHLINTSSFGEYTYDESFGCSIWHIEFDNMKTDNTLRQQMVESIQKSLLQHEKRLSKVKVSASIKQEQLDSLQDTTRIKKRVDINISGIVKKTNEKFTYFEYFFIGPLSY